MVLQKVAHVLGCVVNPMARILNRIAGVVLAAMMLLTGADVALRYFLNKPIPGSYELTEYMMPVVVAFGLAWCALEDGHVRVDLFTSMMPQRFQKFLKILSDAVLFTIFALIAWQTLERAKGMIVSHQHSEVLYIPIYPFVLVVSLGCAIFCLVALKSIIESLSEADKS